jgi:hypothetical protein
MTRLRSIGVLAVCTVVAGAWMAFPGSAAQTAGQGPIITGNPAPSAEQIRSLILRTMANQHRDDRALEEFERTEHEISRKGQNTEIITDITERILPSGTGNMKLKTAEKGVPVSADDYRRQLETALKALETAMQPSERRNEDLAKFEKRRHDHAELLDEATKAFRVSWAGRETRNDSAGKRTLMKFLLDPDPAYKPINRYAASFQHIHAAIWVDEEQAQFARLEADVATDISFGGGVAGKIYRGGHVVMVQEEVIPGIWLPTLFNYEVDGRKFIVAFGIHERTEISRYRRVGPPDQVAELLRADLKKLVAESSNR